jgi:3-phenylpropionate/trans-cinnamate dioxygenase ferredoxin reductase subunit
VVAGAGIAGLRTVEQLRERGYSGHVVLVGAEPHLPYDRTKLSKEALLAVGEQPWLRDPSYYYEHLDVDVRVHQRARRLDVVSHIIQVEGEELEYSTVVIATGAIPRRVPDLGGQPLRTWEDAQQLRDALRPGRHLAVVGAGLVGCEVAASARNLGVTVHLIDVLDGPLVRVVGERVSRTVADLHRRHGVDLIMGTGVERRDGDDLVLSDGRTICSDMILEAIGIAPDTGWLSESDVKLADGVLCDADGLAAPDVYAVGDVARWNGIRNEHWTSAIQQADHVAAVICGHAAPPPEVPYWWSDQYGIKIQGLGAPARSDDAHIGAGGPRSTTVALYARQGRPVAAVGFSAARTVMRLRSDIAAGSSIDVVLARLGTPFG